MGAVEPTGLDDPSAALAGPPPRSSVVGSEKGVTAADLTSVINRVANVGRVKLFCR